MSQIEREVLQALNQNGRNIVTATYLPLFPSHESHKNCYEYSLKHPHHVCVKGWLVNTQTGSDVTYLVFHTIVYNLARERFVDITKHYHNDDVQHPQHRNNKNFNVFLVHYSNLVFNTIKETHIMLVLPSYRIDASDKNNHIVNEVTVTKDGGYLVINNQ